MVEPVEPWLRGTLAELDPLRRGVIHALLLASEDAERWCRTLHDKELEAGPFGLPSVGFQMRHMVRSLDRLLTYAEDKQLDERQSDALKSEVATKPKHELFAEFEAAMLSASQRVRKFLPEDYSRARGVGRQRLQTTVGALLVHCADHTQRHAGQMVTTAKLVTALRTTEQP